MKRALQTLVGLGISAAALWLTLRGKDLHAIWQAAREADYRYLLAYFLVLTFIHLTRTVRWGILLEPVAKVPFGRLNAISAVGLMALVLMPFRLGELARPYLVAERPRLRVAAALSSVVVERVVDGLFGAGLLLIGLVSVRSGSPGIGLARGAGWVMLLGFAAVLAFMGAAFRNRALVVRLTDWLLAPISARLAERVAGMMDAFIHGLRLVPNRRKLGLFLGLTVLYWGLAGFGMHLLARGFDLRLGLWQAYTVLGILVVGVMIPAAPGSVGTFQYAVLLGLSLFLAKETVDVRGQAYAHVLWAAQMAQLTGFGLLFLFSRHIKIGRLVHAPEEPGEEAEAEGRPYRPEEASSLGPQR